MLNNNSSNGSAVCQLPEISPYVSFTIEVVYYVAPSTVGSTLSINGSSFAVLEETVCSILLSRLSFNVFSTSFTSQIFFDTFFNLGLGSKFKCCANFNFAYWS